MKPHAFRVLPRSSGFVMLDALIAIVIFAIGILGMVKLQANAVAFASDAQNRTQAANLADQVIAQMWNTDLSQLSANFTGAGGSGGGLYTAWNNNVTSVTNGLPGASSSIVVGANNLVTVTIQWQAPSDTSPHTYVSISQVTR